MLIVAHWAGCTFWYLSRWQVENMPNNGINQYTGARASACLRLSAHVCVRWNDN
jgi:hypothetical protein